MALDVEEIVDGSVDGEESLGRLWRFEALHLSLSSSYRLMGVFGFEYNIVWLKMTGEQFTNGVVEQLNGSKQKGFEALRFRGLIHADRRMTIDLVSDLLQQNSPPSEYLLGQEPTWADIVKSRAANRTCFTELIEATTQVRARSTNSEFIILTGTAGSGKTTTLMWLATQLNKEALTVGWIDSGSKYSEQDLMRALAKFDSMDALLINSADIYGQQLSALIKAVLDRYPRLLLVIEARSAKVDTLIKPLVLGTLKHREVTMPNLTDDDVEGVLDVLTRENRLGVLRGKTRFQQRKAFKEKAGRQLLVAMYEATSGRKFEERAADELNDLTSDGRLVYGIVSAASAYRFKLTRDEVLIASGASNNNALNQLENLIRRKLINNAGGDLSSVIARHRVIAEMIYNALVRNGEFQGILRGLLRVCVAKTRVDTPRTSRLTRLSNTVISHNYIKRTVGADIGRGIYGDFQDGLAWNYHYWLHRGALELETGNLSLSENFLNQALNLSPNNLFIQSELAYLKFKKANVDPNRKDAQELIDDACQSIEIIISRSPDKSAHAYHILGSQGLEWAEQGIDDIESKKQFLDYLIFKVE